MLGAELDGLIPYLAGGLKQVEQTLGISRPADLEGVDGAEAVWLWYRWHHYGDKAAREKLLRYCGADVLALKIVCATLLEAKELSFSPLTHSEVWDLLDVDHQPKNQAKVSAI